MPGVPPIKFTLFGGRKKQRPNYQLTTLGKTKAEETRIGGPKGEVLMSLENNSPCTIAELASDTKMSPGMIKQILNNLTRDGWVRKVTTEE